MLNSEKAPQRCSALEAPKHQRQKTVFSVQQLKELILILEKSYELAN